MGDLLYKYTAHLESDEHPGFTFCGETPQGWQFPNTDPGGGQSMPPYDWDAPKPGDTIRQCQACFRKALNA